MLSRGPRLWNKLATKKTKVLTYDKLFKECYKRFTPKYGKWNCFFKKIPNQPLTVLRKLTQGLS